MISFRKSTPPQNRHLNVSTSNCNQLVDDLVGELAVMNTFCEIRVRRPTRLFDYGLCLCRSGLTDLARPVVFLASKSANLCHLADKNVSKGYGIKSK